MSPDEVLASVESLCGGRVREKHQDFGDATVVIDRDGALEVFRTLRERAELSFDLLRDVTVVDYLGRTPRFDVVYHLYSLGAKHGLRVKIPVPEEDPSVPSLCGIWKSANWLEREAWDMFGIRFTDHPDLRRILMYEEFVGHPLRKDYPFNKRQPLTPERDPIEVGWKV